MNNSTAPETQDRDVQDREARPREAKAKVPDSTSSIDSSLSGIESHSPNFNPPSTKNYYSGSKIFPLYLCPFEKYLRLDQRPEYPMTFVITMKFRGQLRKADFDSAIELALDRHRILKCTIGTGKQGRLSWLYRSDLMPRIRWCAEGDPIECPEGVRFDDEKEAGLRIWVHQGEENVVVTFYFSHVHVDGIGAHMFMGDLWACYANEVEGPGTARLANLNPSLLKNRGHRQRYADNKATHERSTMGALKYLVSKGLKGCRPLGTPKLPNQKPNLRTPLFGICAETLSPDQHKQLRKVAVENGGTVNDLLAAETFMLIAHWNKKYPAFNPGRSNRILLPTSLRGRGDEEMPAINMTSYSFLIRRAKDCLDRKQLLKSIRHETATLKSNSLGTEFIEVITRADKTSWGMQAATMGRRSLGSIILSSVGDPTKRYTARLPRNKGTVVAGNLQLEDFTGSPPLRDKTRAAISITTYRRQLTVSLRCDPHLYEARHAKEMLEMFMTGLKSWVD